MPTYSNLRQQIQSARSASDDAGAIPLTRIAEELCNKLEEVERVANAAMAKAKLAEQAAIDAKKASR
jgi:hypothetical protein